MKGIYMKEMKKRVAVICLLFVTMAQVGCGLKISKVDEAATETISEEVVTEENELVFDNEVEEYLRTWDGASYDLYLEYMEEPTSYSSYEDFYDIICYMLLNHITSYEFTIEAPNYDADRIKEILEEDIVTAYNDVSLFLNTYTDFWSEFTGACSQTVDQDGNLVSITYTFTLAQKDGMDTQEVYEKQLESEEVCWDLINEMFEEGYLSLEMSAKERAYVIYQWVGENISYAYENGENNIKQDNCYNAIVEGSAVCQGITGAYIELCRLAGVEMYIQVGYTDDGAHSWCKIQDEDAWVYIDPTWGITGASDNETYTNKWFWVTQEFMESYENNSRVFTTYVK